MKNVRNSQEMKVYLAWKNKVAIVEEAYSQENNIKPTACKYNVRPLKICHWKKRMETLLGQSGMKEAKKAHILCYELKC